jgi:hypothetical protein
VLSRLRADLGGTSRNDIIFGSATNESEYSGGVRILFTDLGRVPDHRRSTRRAAPSDYMTDVGDLRRTSTSGSTTRPRPLLRDLAVGAEPRFDGRAARLHPDDADGTERTDTTTERNDRPHQEGMAPVLAIMVLLVLTVIGAA